LRNRSIYNLIKIIALNYRVKIEFKILHSRKEYSLQIHCGFYLHGSWKCDRVNQEIASRNFMSMRLGYTTNSKAQSLFRARAQYQNIKLFLSKYASHALYETHVTHLTLISCTMR